MKRSIDGEMVKGHTDMLILALLHSGVPCTAISSGRNSPISLIRWCIPPSGASTRFSGKWRRGWLKSRTETVCESRVRNTYRITASGRAELKRRAKKWELFSAGINRLLKSCK